MINLQAIKPRNQLITSNLTSTVKELSSSLKTIAPQNSEKEGVYSELSQTTQIITYVLVGTVIAGLVVYHYIKNHESN
jgi:hypothetical protein